MGTSELKASIHKIVDEIKDEQLLRTIYDFLKVREASTPGHMWDSLSQEQKNEVLLAYDESEEEANLVDKDKIFNGEK